MTTLLTKNFKLSLPDFRAGPWHDLINNDLIKIDNLIYGALSSIDTAPWTNSFHYDVGVTVIDDADATTWMASVDHTSAATPTTFAADRAAHPTYWVRLLTGFAPRGEWAHDTHYFPYDLAYQSALGIFALCTIEHVSNAGGTIVNDQAFWSFLVDFHALVSLPSDPTKANLASPVFTGNPAAPTPAPGDNDTSIATTAFVTTVANLKANLASPALTGNPTAPTPTVGDNDTSLATTAFVTAAVAAGVAAAAAAATAAAAAALQPILPGGRLSLHATNAIMLANVNSGATVYYLPYVNAYVPVWTGTAWTMVSIGAGVNQANTDATKSPATVIANKIYDMFVWNDAGTIRCTRGPAWTNATTRSLLLTRQNGIWLNATNITNGPLASRGTWVGTIASSPASAIDWVRGTATFGGTQQAILNVWNAYNRTDIKTTVSDVTVSWTYALAAWRQANAATNRVNLVLGATEEDVYAEYVVSVQTDTTNPSLGWAGIGIDVTNAISGVGGHGAGENTGVEDIFGIARGTWNGQLAPGTHVITALESSPQVLPVTYYGQASGNQSMGLTVNLKM